MVHWYDKSCKPGISHPSLFSHTVKPHKLNKTSHRRMAFHYCSSNSEQCVLVPSNSKTISETETAKLKLCLWREREKVSNSTAVSTTGLHRFKSGVYAGDKYVSLYNLRGCDYRINIHNELQRRRAAVGTCAMLPHCRCRFDIDDSDRSSPWHRLSKVDGLAASRIVGLSQPSQLVWLSCNKDDLPNLNFNSFKWNVCRFPALTPWAASAGKLPFCSARQPNSHCHQSKKKALQAVKQKTLKHCTAVTAVQLVLESKPKPSTATVYSVQQWMARASKSLFSL